MGLNSTTEVSHVDQNLPRRMPPRLSTLLTNEFEGRASPTIEGRPDRPVIFHFMRHG